MFEQSKWFFSEFSKIFSTANASRQQAISEYNNNPSFTTFIISEINKIIKSQNYQSQNEYYRIDAMGYTSRQKELPKQSDIKLNQHLWDLEIAVEHENDHRDWLDEVIKLAHICCPLRVVIGYMPMNLRNNDIEYLDHAAKALQMLKCRDNLLSGEFMVILGNSNTKGNPEYYFNYKAYVLNKDNLSFEKLSL